MILDESQGPARATTVPGAIGTFEDPWVERSHPDPARTGFSAEPAPEESRLRTTGTSWSAASTRVTSETPRLCCSER